MALSLAVLVSGSGSNLQSILDKVESGALQARIALVLSNNPEAYGLERARNHGVAVWAASHADFPTREAFDRAMLEQIEKAGADVVVMAGYMRLLSSVFLAEFPERILNIHPALPPCFPGVHGQADAANHGVKISGCTVHLATEHMDNGPIIIQAAVPAHPGESGSELGKRILALEHRVYPQALQWFATGRLRMQGRQVFLAEPPEPIAKAELPAGCLVNPPLEQGF